MRPITVYTAEQQRAAIATNPNNLFTLQKKGDKAYKGTKYLDVKWNVVPGESSSWFSVTDLVLAGTADPNDKNDRRNQFDGASLRNQLETSINDAGAFGEFIKAAEDCWQKQVGAMVANGEIKGRKIHGLYAKHYGENHKDKAGQELANPKLNLKMKFGTYPATHPTSQLRGKPCIEILDFTKVVQDAVTGARTYAPATVVDPVSGRDVPVDEKNFYLFITEGSILRHGRVNIPSVAISQSWVSMPLEITRAVIERTPVVGFSDDIAPPEDVNYVAAATANTLPEPVAQPLPEDVDDLINAI